jgi:hypothetical protein
MLNLSLGSTSSSSPLESSVSVCEIASEDFPSPKLEAGASQGLLFGTNRWHYYYLRLKTITAAF